MAGDYGHFATYLEPGALEFLARLDVAPGTRMLDVACGAGQIAIPAARAGACVTGIDIASNWIEQAQRSRPWQREWMPGLTKATQRCLPSRMVRSIWL